MKKYLMIILLFIFINFTAFATRQNKPTAKTDTAHKPVSKTKPHLAKSRRDRMQLQQQQIRFHEAQLKKVHKAQEEVYKETHNTN